jgi:hypothetical protein
MQMAKHELVLNESTCSNTGYPSRSCGCSTCAVKRKVRKTYNMDDEDDDDDDEEDEDEDEVDNRRRLAVNADVLADPPPTVNAMEHAFDTGLTGGSYVRAGNPGQDHERGRQIHTAEDLINAMTDDERRDLIRKLGGVPADLPAGYGNGDDEIPSPAGLFSDSALEGRMADQGVERGSKGLSKPKRAKRNGAPSPVEGVGGEGSRIEDLDFRGRRALEVHKPTSNGYGEILENPLDGLGDADCLRRAVVLNELDRRSNLAKQIATPRRQVPVRNRQRYATTSSDTLGDPPGLWTS